MTRVVRGFVLVFATLWLSQHCHAAELNTLSEEQKQDGWKALFDGESIDDWKVVSGKATYRIEDDAIVGKTEKGSPNTFLVPPGEYGDFELTFQVLLNDNQLNTGVQIRSQLKGDNFGGRLHGPQVEIESGPGQSGFIYGEALGTGWLSPEPKSKDKSVKQTDAFKNGEWNDYRILAKGDKIQTWINGQMIADLKLPAEVMKNHEKGMIGLQVHGVGDRGPYQVRWRNIYLKELGE